MARRRRDPRRCVGVRRSLNVEDYIYGHLLRQGTLTRSPAAPSAAATPTAAASDAAATVAAIAGDWTGTLVEPGSSSGPAASYGIDASSGVTFDATVTIDATCVMNARCGSLLAHTALWPPTGQPLTCRFDLTFRGFYQGSAALSFDEVPAASQSKDCAAARLVVTPLTSGQAIAVEEMANGSTFDRGVLTRSVTP